MERAQTLASSDAWQLCVRRRHRLHLAAARMGLAEDAEDLVHDTFVEVMKLPRLYRAGFDALLDTVLWRRCRAVQRRNEAHAKLWHDARLLPDIQADHADQVIDRLYAAWLVGCCDCLDTQDLLMLNLVSEGYNHTDIASLTGNTQVTDALRAVRRKARREIAQIRRA